MGVSQDGLIKPIKVQIGEQHGDDVEILSGLTPNDRIVARGVGFLHAGDRVKVVQVGPEEPAMPAMTRTAPDTMAARARNP